MKLTVFILLIASINLYGQADSTVLLRKQVVRCLIANHYTAVKLSEENSVLRNQQTELLKQIKLYKGLQVNHREDSILCDSLISLNKGVANTWKESYEAEKHARRRTQRKLRVITIGTIATTVANILLWLL